MKKRPRKKDKVSLLELRKMSPFSDGISIKSLFFAINRDYKIFLTADQNILDNARIIKKKYGIRIITGLHELNEKESKQFYGNQNIPESF